MVDRCVVCETLSIVKLNEGILDWALHFLNVIET